MMTGGRVLPSARRTHAYRAHEPDIDRAAERLSRAASAAGAGAADAGVRARHRARRRHRRSPPSCSSNCARSCAEPTRRPRPRTDDPARLLFRPLEPFLVEGKLPMRPGQIRRASLLPVWQWLIRDGAPDQARRIRGGAGASCGIPRRGGRSKPAVRKFQRAAAEAIFKIATPGIGDDQQRALARVGPPDVIEDLLPIGSVLQAREALDTLNGRLPSHCGTFGESADRLGQRLAQRSLAADAATAAVRAVAGDAAADRAVADHPPRHQDGRVRR